MTLRLSIMPKKLWKQAKVYNEKNELTEIIENPDYIARQLPVKTVNTNAYEIRNDILGKALSWVQYKKEFDTLKILPTEDEVLEVTQKFYKFVENRK